MSQPLSTHAVPPPTPSYTPIGAASPAMREVLEAASDVAPTPTTVLLLGESGTGKELLARHIHARSGRGAWVAVNCAALPSELLESELFGHERGAFTGAAERRQGKFEQAHGGTLLLDEISELPLPLQAKLLRVVQEREVDRVGGRQPVPVDVRIVATTNRDLAEMVRRGEFRSDLYYRLHVFPIVLPPLRDRREDLPALAAALLADAARALGRAAPPITPDALAALATHTFPGNVRELRNALERALVRCHGPELEARHLRLDAAWETIPDISVRRAAPEAARGAFAALPLDLSHLERIAIEEALRRVRGNRTHAARLLGIGLRTLRNKLRAYREAGIRIDDPGAAGAADGPELPCAEPDHAPGSAALRAAPRARASQEDAA
jgi:DNA-binding NtrC family response regulator